MSHFSEKLERTQKFVFAISELAGCLLATYEVLDITSDPLKKRYLRILYLNFYKQLNNQIYNLIADKPSLSKVHIYKLIENFHSLFEVNESYIQAKKKFSEDLLKSDFNKKIKETRTLVGAHVGEEDDIPDIKPIDITDFINNLSDLLNEMSIISLGTLHCFNGEEQCYKEFKRLLTRL